MGFFLRNGCAKYGEDSDSTEARFDADGVKDTVVAGNSLGGTFFVPSKISLPSSLVAKDNLPVLNPALRTVVFSSVASRSFRYFSHWS